MTQRRRGRADDSPLSAFVQEMRAAFKKRDAASGPGEKRTVEREVEAIMRRHLGVRTAREVAEGFETAAVRVPRDTTRDQSCHTSGGRLGTHEVSQTPARDGKLAAAGRD